MAPMILAARSPTRWSERTSSGDEVTIEHFHALTYSSFRYRSIRAAAEHLQRKSVRDRLPADPAPFPQVLGHGAHHVSFQVHIIARQLDLAVPLIAVVLGKSVHPEDHHLAERKVGRRQNDETSGPMIVVMPIPDECAGPGSRPGTTPTHRGDCPAQRRYRTAARYCHVLRRARAGGPRRFPRSRGATFSCRSILVLSSCITSSKSFIAASLDQGSLFPFIRDRAACPAPHPCAIRARPDGPVYLRIFEPVQSRRPGRFRSASNMPEFLATPPVMTTSAFNDDAFRQRRRPVGHGMVKGADDVGDFRARRSPGR